MNMERKNENKMSNNLKSYQLLFTHYTIKDVSKPLRVKSGNLELSEV